MICAAVGGVSLALSQLESLGQRCIRLLVATGMLENDRQIHQGLSSEDRGICLRTDLGGLASEPIGFVQASLPRENASTRTSPDGLSIHVIRRGDLLGNTGDLLGLVDPTLQLEHASQEPGNAGQ